MTGTKEHYDKLYAENETVFERGEPEDIVRQILEYKQSGTVLEVGAGEGRNALFLAEHGFQVTALDISPVGVAKIQERAKALGVPITAEVKDATEGISGSYDVIVSTFVLHHLFSEDALRLVRQMQESAAPGGLNAVTAFTKKGDFYTANPKTQNFYPDLDQLRELYNGWEILGYQETRGPAFQKKPDGSPMMNTSSRIIARKKS